MSCRESMKCVLFLAFLLTGTFSEPDGSEISSSIEPTLPNEFPFMVRLHIGNNRCGASLIAPRFLATSSHCFYESSGRGLRIFCSTPGYCYAVIGEHDTTKEEDGQRKIELNRSIGFHKAIMSGLAIVELEYPVELDDKAQIVRVAEDWLSVDDKVLSLGWGMTSEGTFPSVLQKVQLKVSEVNWEWSGGRLNTVFGKNANNTAMNLVAAAGGGPLLARRNGEWLLYAILNIWRANETTNAWNPLAPKKDWIQEFLYKPDLTLVYSQPGELKLKKGHLIETLPRLGKEWEISFEFKPENYDQSGFTSILHLSTGEDSSVVGSRIPAIFHHPERGLHVATAIGNDPNSYRDIKISPPVGNWSTIVLSQLNPGSRTTMSVNVDGAARRSMKNPEPREFSNVKVYGSDPWYEAQPGLIRGLTIKTK